MALPDQQCVPDTLYIWLKVVIYPIWAMYLEVIIVNVYLNIRRKA